MYLPLSMQMLRINLYSPQESSSIDLQISQRKIQWSANLSRTIATVSELADMLNEASGPHNEDRAPPPRKRTPQPITFYGEYIYQNTRNIGRNNLVRSDCRSNGRISNSGKIPESSVIINRKTTQTMSDREAATGVGKISA